MWILSEKLVKLAKPVNETLLKFKLPPLLVESPCGMIGIYVKGNPKGNLKDLTIAAIARAHKDIIRERKRYTNLIIDTK